MHKMPTWLHLIAKKYDAYLGQSLGPIKGRKLWLLERFMDNWSQWVHHDLAATWLIV
jgi:hypothetical protein